jgi:hypothetical protein
VSVRALADVFGRLLGREPVLQGTEADTAWLVNTSLATRTFGYPQVSLGQMIIWTADWLGRKMPSIAKKTFYDARPTAEAAVAAR